MAEEGDLRRKHSTCVWKKNIFFEQTRLSASFPRSTIISAQCCFQKEKKSRARDRGKRKNALQPENKRSRTSGTFAGGGGLGAVGKAGVPGCLPRPWAQGPHLNRLPSSPVGMAALGSEPSQGPRPSPPNPTQDLLCPGPGEVQHPGAQTTSCTEGPVAALTLQGARAGRARRQC